MILHPIYYIFYFVLDIYVVAYWLFLMMQYPYSFSRRNFSPVLKADFIYAISPGKTDRKRYRKIAVIGQLVFTIYGLPLLLEFNTIYCIIISVVLGALISYFSIIGYMNTFHFSRNEKYSDTRFLQSPYDFYELFKSKYKTTEVPRLSTDDITYIISSRIFGIFNAPTPILIILLGTKK